MTPLKAIRAKCLDCSCGSVDEVRKCPITECPLYEYRSGHNPKRKGISGAKHPNHKPFKSSSLKDKGVSST